ncbi:MAG: type VII toxin-antitoxin system HepT family RNase toxin [Thermoanaerobaculia bacterium]
MASFRHYWLAERGLQLAAEALLDSGNHVLVAHFNVSPSDYEDVITQLGEQGVLTPALRDRLRGLGGFRNVLVHGYVDIDRERVYDTLQEELDDLIAFADELEAFLERLES